MNYGRKGDPLLLSLIITEVTGPQQTLRNVQV